jgi:hypothetical protein
MLISVIIRIAHHVLDEYRSQWPRGLRHELSSLAQTLGSRVRISLEAWMSVCVYSVCAALCAGSGLATGCVKVQETEKAAKVQQRAVEP